jgi:Uma2 family endonuclease
MAIEQRMSESAYQAFVLSGVEGNWELHDGRLVEKPGMTWEHNDIVAFLSYLLQQQIDRGEYRVHYESRVRRSTASVFMPDLLVVPNSLGDEFRGRPGTLAIFSDPLPLVVEVWSHSTGDYDIDAKIPEYRRRGDLEIWRLHPYERTLTSWIRQADGSYDETVYHERIVRPAALPGVVIDLAVLFTELSYGSPRFLSPWCDAASGRCLRIGPCDNPDVVMTGPV